MLHLYFMLDNTMMRTEISYRVSKGSQALLEGQPDPLPSPDRAGPLPERRAAMVAGAAKDWEAKERRKTRLAVEYMIEDITKDWSLLDLIFESDAIANFTS
jgi:hypothetical protein